MRKIFTLCLIISLSICAHAQTRSGKISGTIHDQSGKPLQSVSMALLKANDSSLVKAVATNKDGKYAFDKVVEGNYIISASSVGFGREFTKVIAIDANNTTVDAGMLQLTQKAKGLTEVVSNISDTLLYTT